MSAPAQATDIVFTRHPAARGLAWLRESWGVFGQARVQWLVLVGLYYLLMLLASFSLGLVHPVLGQLATMLLKPVFAVGFLAAAWAQERGQRPLPKDLFRGFHSNLPALLGCGAAMILGALVAVLVVRMIAGEAIVELLTATEPPGEDMLGDPRLQWGLIVGAVVALPVVLALWFAPALVVFQDAGTRTALGASLRAAAANWRPILVYAVAVFVVGAMVPVLLAQVFLAILPDPLGRSIVSVLLAFWGMMLAATLHVSDYVSYRDIFHSGETLAPLTHRGGR